MAYTPNPAAKGQTVVFVAARQHYPNGWCAAVKGGTVTSQPGNPHLTIRTIGHPLQVFVSVTSGQCPSSSG
jgi:hypothetical protein